MTTIDILQSLTLAGLAVSHFITTRATLKNSQAIISVAKTVTKSLQK